MEKVRMSLSKLPPAILSGITLLAILWLTLAPKPLGDNAPTLFEGADKVVHGLMFGFLTAIMLLDWQRIHCWQRVTWGQATLYATCTSFIGMAIEFAQEYMSLGRGFEGSDILADTIGAFSFAVAWVLLQKFWLPKSS